MSAHSRSRQRKKTVSSRPRSAELPAARDQRLQKVLAAAGLGSRRECEQFIVEGRVEIDRQVVTELGTRVNVEDEQIRVDGVVIRPAKVLYYMVNKPRGVVATNRDPEGRLRVVDLVDSQQRLFTVGRLDKSSEGLLLVTNDGDLANRLTHPRYGVPKTYLVQVVGMPTEKDLESLRRGVHLAEGVAQVASVKVRRRQKNGAVLEMVLNEGRNREIRRLLARIGHKVTRLSRMAVGPLKLGDLPPGAHRLLTPNEIKLLRKAISGPGRRSKPRQANKPAARRANASRPIRKKANAKTRLTPPNKSKKTGHVTRSGRAKKGRR